eukprot:scaffold1879_cov97-Skeletonema_marinoi.AAC.2
MHLSTPSPPESTNDMILTDDETAEELSADEVAIIFGFLSPYDIMRARVCKTWRDAAKKTAVPPSYEYYSKIYNVRSYNAVRAMSTALPNLDQLMISRLTDRVGYQSHHARLDIISSFRELRVLYVVDAHLTGRYPVLFNFPLLKRLRITYCRHLKFDLDMLLGFPLLEVLDFSDNQHLTGNISSLSPLKSTLKSLDICRCLSVRGNFMELADFPHLKNLYLFDTPVTGDIRDIRANDFPALESLYLPDTVHGGMKYKFRHVSEVPSFMHTVHLLSQRTPALLSKHFLSRAFDWRLSEDSPDWYENHDWYESDVLGALRGLSPPFLLQFIQAGSRRGWSWCTFNRVYLCEINWLDPEPSSGSSDYEAYIEELMRIENRVNFYRGYYQPPSEEEYNRLSVQEE